MDNPTSKALADLLAKIDKNPKMRRAIKAALKAMKEAKPTPTPDSRELMKAKPAK
jgi:hypothetical protein